MINKELQSIGIFSYNQLLQTLTLWPKPAKNSRDLTHSTATAGQGLIDIVILKLHD